LVPQKGQSFVTFHDGTELERPLLDERIKGHADQADIARIIFDEQEVHSSSPTFRGVACAKEKPGRKKTCCT